MRHLLIFYYTNLFPYTIFATALAVQGEKTHLNYVFILAISKKKIKRSSKKKSKKLVKKVKSFKIIL